MLETVDKLVRLHIDNLYRRVRRTEIGIDPRIETPVLAAWLLRRGAQRARAWKLGYRTAFVGRSFRRKCRTKLRIGRAVSIGDGVTIDALSATGVYIGSHSTIDDFAVLRGSGVVRNLGVGIRIGANSSIGAYNVLLGQGGISIGNDCLIGPNVTILSENHNFDDVSMAIRTQGETRLKTQIGNDVWIGAGAVVLGGSRIGDGVVVAAGAVVRGEIEAYSVVGGVPARVIRRRTGK
jgi:acetyltransferase-like isoleucine patch superfamily enzyme